MQPDRGVFDTDLPKQVLQNEYLVIHFKGMKLANSLQANAMNVINTNIRAQFAQAALSMIERRQSVAMERLSTGKRINSARDDAAGLAIAARMSELIRGTHQAIQNANNGIGMIQTAESAAGQIGDRLQRMRELAVQASNGTYSNGQRQAMDLEYQQLKQDIVAVSRNTRWNGMSLMNAQAGTLVNPKALYKTVSAGQWAQQYGGQTALTGQLYDPRTSPTTVSQTDLQVSSPVNFAHKGKIVLDFTGSGTAQFLALDGSV
ncbi:MAG: A-type flagellin, partial [Pseudomonadota bacterium]